jgi:hypothetical protein
MSIDNEKIISECNALARAFYSAHGYEVPEDYRFDQALHPQERSMWDLAVIAYDHIEGTDIEEILAEMEEDNG